MYGMMNADGTKRDAASGFVRNVHKQKKEHTETKEQNDEKA